MSIHEELIHKYQLSVKNNGKDVTLKRPEIFEVISKLEELSQSKADDPNYFDTKWFAHTIVFIESPNGDIKYGEYNISDIAELLIKYKNKPENIEFIAEMIRG